MNSKLPTWSSDLADVKPTLEHLHAEEKLALTDRIIGLEQQVKELQEASIVSPSQKALLETNYANVQSSVSAMQSSMTWRIGRTVMLPVRVLRYLKRRIIR